MTKFKHSEKVEKRKLSLVNWKWAVFGVDQHTQKPPRHDVEIAHFLASKLLHVLRRTYFIRVMWFGPLTIHHRDTMKCEIICCKKRNEKIIIVIGASRMAENWNFHEILKFICKINTRNWVNFPNSKTSAYFSQISLVIHLIEPKSRTISTQKRQNLNQFFYTKFTSYITTTDKFRKFHRKLPIADQASHFSFPILCCRCLFGYKHHRQQKSTKKEEKKSSKNSRFLQTKSELAWCLVCMSLC